MSQKKIVPLQKNTNMAELRMLLPKEKAIVKKLVDLRQNLTKSNLADFHSAKILEQIINLDFVALVWDLKEASSVRVYYIPDKDNKEKAQKTFFEICDYLFLLEDLENAEYITLQEINSNTENKEKRIIYNRRKYQQIEKDSETFLRRSDDESGILYWKDMSYLQYNIKIADYLERYVFDRLVYPRNAMVDYEKKHYRTIENRRHRTQNRWNFVSLSLSTIAIIISIIIPTQCATKIESKDLQRIAKSKDQDIKHADLSSCPMIPSPCDTINAVKPIEQ